MPAQTSTGKVILALAAGAASFITSDAAQAQQQTAQATLPATNAAITRTAPIATVPQDVCAMASGVLNDYVVANISRITDPADRTQLSILNQWIKAGCQGTVRLARTNQAIAAATHLQATLGSRYNFSNVITLG